MIPLKGQGLASQFLGPKFESLGMLGCGSYGEVYKVRHK